MSLAYEVFGEKILNRLSENKFPVQPKTSRAVTIDDKFGRMTYWMPHSYNFLLDYYTRNLWKIPNLAAEIQKNIEISSHYFSLERKYKYCPQCYNKRSTWRSGYANKCEGRPSRYPITFMTD